MPVTRPECVATMMRMALAVMACGCLALPALAASVTVPVTELGLEETVFLPTMYAQREIQFAKPKTWNLQSGKVVVTFQHSHQLTPNSWFQVLLNDKVLKHVPLTKANAEGTTLAVSLPVASLEDFNRLIFRVEQHYAPTCEDPLDASLWTNVLGEKTALSFTYAPRTLPLTLNQFPFPLVDGTTLAAQPITYVVPAQAGGDTLAATATVNAALAREVPKRGLTTTAVLDSGAVPAGKGHVVVTGTPGQWSDGLKQWLGRLALTGYRLSGDQWQDSAGNTADDGFVALAAYPGKPGQYVLIVSGNNEAAVGRAAQYLSAQRQEPLAMGQAALVPAGWTAPPASEVGPSYIADESRTLEQLGYDTLSVEKIVAPPIVIDVPITTDVTRSGSDVLFDFFYSYSAKLNPEFSALELRLNNHPIANLPLTNENGEDRVAAQVVLPKDLLKVGNQLVAQFHLMPDKQGYCVDMYEDESWGKLHSDSTFRLQGSPSSLLPSLGVLTQGRGFPYTATNDLSETQLVLSRVSAADVQALLAVTSRLGRQSGEGALKVAPIQLSVAVGEPSAGPDDHVIWIDSGNTQALKERLKLGVAGSGQQVQLSYTGKLQKASITSPAIDKVAFVEQVTLGNGRVLTRLAASDAAAMLALAETFQEDEAFATLPDSAAARSSALSDQVDDVATVPTEETATTRIGDSTATTSDNPIVAFWQRNAWFRWVVYIVGGLILLLGVIPFLVRALFGGRR